MEVESFKKIAKDLHDLGLCPRCILRFTDERDTSLYEGDDEVSTQFYWCVFVELMSWFKTKE